MTIKDMKILELSIDTVNERGYTIDEVEGKKYINLTSSKWTTRLILDRIELNQTKYFC